jgi:hypothetical protein
MINQMQRIISSENKVTITGSREQEVEVLLTIMVNLKLRMPSKIVICNDIYN